MLLEKKQEAKELLNTAIDIEKRIVIPIAPFFYPFGMVLNGKTIKDDVLKSKNILEKMI